VRRIPVFFAEARVRRPSVGSQTRPESLAGGDVVPRQEVSERIGLGEAHPAKAGGSWPVKPRLAVAALSPRRAVRKHRSSKGGIRGREIPAASW